METEVDETTVRRSKRRRSEDVPAGGKEEKPTGRVVVDFSLVYQQDALKTSLRASAGGRSLHETIFTKTQRIVDDRGRLMESRILEQIKWTTQEVEYLIMLRSQGDALFSQALKDKKLGRVWEKAAFGLSKDATVRKDAKQCQWMWYVLMKEYNNVLEGTKKEDEFPFYLQMQQTRKYRTPSGIAGM